MKRLYIHIPFCKSRCGYCSFVAYSPSKNSISEYMSYLYRELGLAAALADGPLKSIYFGGGTPSILSPDQIKNVFNTIKDLYEISEDAEITFEMNPESVSAEKLEALKGSGVSRISLGIQSTDNAVLKQIGRLHNAESAMKAIDLIEMAGFTNINVDFITGFLGQTKTDVEKFVEIAAENSIIKHISAYSLTLDPDVRIKSALSDDDERDLFAYLLNLLDQAGFKRYEISNFAIPGFEAQHNSAYWTGEDYYGAGISAAGLIDRKRLKNPDDFKTYYKMLDQGILPNEITENLTDDEILFEQIILGLRTVKGVDLRQMELRFGISIEARYADAVGRSVSRGLLLVQGGRMYIPPDKMDVSNQVLMEFVNNL